MIGAHELIVDNFAGGGGASLAIEMALGRSPDIAINHDAKAIAMHAANHPNTLHYCSDVWEVDPVVACRGWPVGLAWFSPDCKHFSKAKGGRPKDNNIRGLAWVVVRWAETVRPRVIILENVEEFQDWGPLRDDGTPDPLLRGFTYRQWKQRLEAAGYVVESKQLRAHDFGAPTSRKRLFVVARCDGLPIVWPEPTCGPGRAHPFSTAAECIDWSINVPSIFEREKPLAEKTLRRIARGITRFVLATASPFIVPLTHTGDSRVYDIEDPLRTITGANRGEQALIVPTLIQTSWGERPTQVPRVPGLHKPLGTIMAGGAKHALVAAFLAKHYGGHENAGASLERPLSTITTRDHHSLVCAFLLKYYGTSTAQSAREPMATITAEGIKHALVTVKGEQYRIADIGMRMLVPRELYRAQGFCDEYIIDPIYEGRPLNKTEQVRKCGNSVSPPPACALVYANCGAASARVAA